jgi:hypothetical protein
MAVKRFLLDTSQLNDATFGLDGGLAFILDSSQLDGTRVLDGGEFLTTATGSSSLGGISATGSATVTHFASASAPLGELIAETADVFVTVDATAEALLGGLDASAQAKAKKSATASADLGGLDASATTKVSKTVIASADLGGLDASATTKVAKSVIASADLGGLVATADATDTPPVPTPEPTPVGGRQYAAPRRKKIEPLPEVEIPVIQPKRRYAVASTTLNGMQAQAVGTITFSILDDDAEVLLLV